MPTGSTHQLRHHPAPSEHRALEEGWSPWAPQRRDRLIALAADFLTWCSDRLAAAGQTTLVLVWDNVSWHVSQWLRTWLRAHNQRVQREGGVHIIPCFLPKKRPGLNPIEPKWVHGKRRIVEPARLLTARKLEERVGAAFACPLTDHLAIPQEVS